jgi:hypothetical protein
MGEIYEVRIWDGLRCHDIHIKFHKDWFRHLKINGERGDSQTHGQHGDCISPLPLFQNKKGRLKTENFVVSVSMNKVFQSCYCVLFVFNEELGNWYQASISVNLNTVLILIRPCATQSKSARFRRFPFLLYFATCFGLTGHHQVHKMCLRSRKKKQWNLADFDWVTQGRIRIGTVFKFIHSTAE